MFVILLFVHRRTCIPIDQLYNYIIRPSSSEDGLLLPSFSWCLLGNRPTGPTLRLANVVSILERCVSSSLTEPLLTQFR